jgi:ubiquinone/menaquinone biosynthesis C-methylase UbiE
MSRISFENYGRNTKEMGSKGSPTVIAGRYETQLEFERYIFFDVIDKLKIEHSDSVLDIGSGPGSIAIPLSFICEKVTAIDHSYVLDGMRKRCGGLYNLFFQNGNFLDIETNEKFNKIIVYSVLQYLEDEQEVMEFILKAISMLHIGGAILLGDIPNVSKKARFIESEFGKKFINEWGSVAHTGTDKLSFDSDDKTPVFNDSMILSIIEKVRFSGFHAYVLPQLTDLPFGHTREDILIVKPGK